ncbi:hypothetical protein TWF481_011861 [Arthrobotrys musiformis]|uniref:Transcription initiation factor TFIID subunit 4 n=1 Tax=Arthrobotrys musiformis TaxID=47236 RepID=A0AAV9VWV9_9PEZI
MSKQTQYPILAPAVSSSPPILNPQMPPTKRARLEPVSGANSPGPGTPIPHPSAAFAASMSMPPPSSTSPIQKPVDTKDLTDVLFSTGVDLQAEEQYLYNDTPAASFAGPNASLPGGVSAEERALNRQQAEASGKLRHGQDPFLRREKLLHETHQKLIREKITSHADHNTLTELLSIAAQEHMRELLTTATQYAQYRRRGNMVKGIGEWADIAFGESEGQDGRLKMELPEGETVDSPSGGVSRKRSFAQANSSTVLPRNPSLLSETAKSMRTIATDDRLIEEARVAARLARINGTKTGTPAADGAGGENPNPPPGSVAPEPEKRMTAKEAKKAQNSRLDEIQSHKAANETASLMLGGGRKKKYSWMSAGSGAGGGSGASTPNRMSGNSGAAVGTPGAAAAAITANAPTMYWGKRMGEWSEQGERGKGIQLRDWIQALELDGRETKALQKAYLKLK